MKVTLILSLTSLSSLLPPRRCYCSALLGFVISKRKRPIASNHSCPGSLHEEAIELFKEMKSVGLEPDKVTHNVLLDVYEKFRKNEEAREVLEEMNADGFLPSIAAYNPLTSAYSKDGISEEAMELKVQTEAKGIESDVIAYTTLILVLEKAGKDELVMRKWRVKDANRISVPTML